MENCNETLLRGLLGITTIVLSSERVFNATEPNKILLVAILTLLGSVFSSDQMINAVKDVISGKYHVNDFTVEPVIAGETISISPASCIQETKGSLADLTRREKDVLGLMVDGLMNKEIARRLGVSEATVKNHVTSILRKLNADVRTEAVVTAIKQGFTYI